jgi:hypothetical protein
MPPIVLLYVLEMVLAALAPVVAIVCIVLAFVGRWQSLCRRLLLIGAVGGCITGGLWLMTLGEQREIIWAFGAAIFATGFSGAIFIFLTWPALRKMLSKTTL